MQWVLEIILMGLLVATLFHAVRLGRALAVLKKDRGPLEQLMHGFSIALRDAQGGIDQLRLTADGAGRRIAEQMERAAALREDLAYLIDRAETIADRLDLAVRSNKAVESAPRPIAPPHAGFAPIRPQNEALEPADGGIKMRSQAERDLMQALRLHK